MLKNFILFSLLFLSASVFSASEKSSCSGKEGSYHGLYYLHSDCSKTYFDGSTLSPAGACEVEVRHRGRSGSFETITRYCWTISQHSYGDDCQCNIAGGGNIWGVIR